MSVSTSIGRAATATLILAMAPVGANAQVAPSPIIPQMRLPPIVFGPVQNQRVAVPVAQPRSGNDRDGDGLAFPDDCDDGDASRYPGNTDVANDRDEDCNPDTIGERDWDRDGFTDYRVSNIANYGPDGVTGEDCDDTQRAINPNAQELPNRLDDNCDGIVDNLLGSWWTPS
jgi:hypothetical protein